MKSLKKAFTLIELLIVIAILGLVMTSIYSVYSTTQTTALGNEEVSDIQQNLRLSVDQMVRDIQMAGFLVTDPSLTVANVDAISFTTVSTDLRISRIENPVTLGTGATQLTVRFDDPALAAKYMPGDLVRIYRPRSNVEPHSTTFTVKVVAPPDLTFVSFTAPSEAVNYAQGDLAFIVDEASDAYPKTVGYELQPVAGSSLQNLVRLDSADGDGVLAGGISGLQLEYILEDGTSAPVSPATTLTAEQREEVVAVRIALSGRARDSLVGRVGQKARTLETVARIRNL